MLGIAGRLCVEKGLDWTFCDTDSMAIAKPDGMGQAEFLERAQSVCAWFAPLNPYEKKGSIFKIEDANYQIAGDSVGSNLEPFQADNSPCADVLGPSAWAAEVISAAVKAATAALYNLLTPINYAARQSRAS